MLSALLISAGARVTEPLLISAAWEGNPGPLVWVRLQQFLGVSLGLPEVISDFCPPGRTLVHKSETLQLLSAGYLLDLAAVMWSTPAVSRSKLGDISFFPSSTARWSPEQHEKLLRLILANAKRAGCSTGGYVSSMLWLKGMLDLPVSVRMELFEAAAASGDAVGALWLQLGHDLTHAQRLQLSRTVLQAPCFDGQAATALTLLPSAEQLTDVDAVQQLLQLAVEVDSLELLFSLVDAPGAEQLPAAAAGDLLKQAAAKDLIECWCLLQRTCCADIDVPLDSFLKLLDECLACNEHCLEHGKCIDSSGDICDYCFLLSEASCHEELGNMALQDVLKLLQRLTAGLPQSRCMSLSIDRICRTVCTVVSRPEEVEQVLELIFDLYPISAAVLNGDDGH